jgi:hypothetical protein
MDVAPTTTDPDVIGQPSPNTSYAVPVMPLVPLQLAPTAGAVPPPASAWIV